MNSSGNPTIINHPMKTDTPFIRLCIPDYHPSGRLLLAHQSPSPWETGDPPKDIKSLSQHSLKRDMAVVFSLFDHLRICKFQKYVLSYCMSILCFGLPLNMLLYVSFYVVLSYLFRSFHCVGRLSVKSGALDSMFSGSMPITNTRFCGGFMRYHDVDSEYSLGSGSTAIPRQNHQPPQPKVE